jgi:hypothetical protein
MKEKAMAIFESKDQKQHAQQYEEHLQLLRMQQEIEHQKMKAREQQALNQIAMNSAAMNMNSSPGTLGGYGQQKKARFNPNSREAFQIPLSQLVTMWQIKHGDQWVEADAPIAPNDDPFYIDGLRRLLKAELFEEYNGWVRLKENVENLLANR